MGYATIAIRTIKSFAEPSTSAKSSLGSEVKERRYRIEPAEYGSVTNLTGYGLDDL